jgi:type I restriction enzyme S subunit
MGKAAIAASRCVTNQQINAVVVDESRFSPEFIYYNLTLRKAEIRGLAGGSAQPIMNKSAFGQMCFDAPALEEQRGIVQMLAPLDDRITLLRATNATLEAIAQTLFKSWFVEFDPVRAKQEGRAPEGMDEATAALFPDGFEESELGLVPRGWRVGSLAELAILNPESWTATMHPDTVAYIDLANTKDNEIAQVIDYVFEDAPSRARRVLRDGDTIVGTVRPGNRSFAFIRQATSNLTASTGFAVLRPREIENTEFVYLTATHDSSIEHLAHVADGGAYPAVRPEVVVGIQAVLPSHQVMKAFHDVTKLLLGSVAENQQQARTLAALRDTLLPRLISGKLRLPEAEAVLEEVAA